MRNSLIIIVIMSLFQSSLSLSRLLTSSVASSLRLFATTASPAEELFTPTAAPTPIPTSIPTSTPLPTPHYSVRPATPSDIAAIKAINLATLPENYTNEFYLRMLREWPGLCMVINADPSSSTASTTSPMSFTPSAGNREEDVVGYVLGKVEHRISAPGGVKGRVGAGNIFSNIFPTQRPPRGRRGGNPDPLSVPKLIDPMVGHITSLSILPGHRRHGLASLLVNNLHINLRERYPDVEETTLHVRDSNEGAKRCYQRLGYSVKGKRQRYYGDGETAVEMAYELD